MKKLRKLENKPEELQSLLTSENTPSENSVITILHEHIAGLTESNRKTKKDYEEKLSEIINEDKNYYEERIRTLKTRTLQNEQALTTQINKTHSEALDLANKTHSEALEKRDERIQLHIEQQEEIRIRLRDYAEMQRKSGDTRIDTYVNLILDEKKTREEVLIIIKNDNERLRRELENKATTSNPRITEIEDEPEEIVEETQT